MNRCYRHSGSVALGVLLLAGCGGDSGVNNNEVIVATTVMASVGSSRELGDGSSMWPELSANGRYVTFGSKAANLINGDTNGVGDVFVRDMVAGTIQRVSVRTYGGEALGGRSLSAGLSSDGRRVAFYSYATNLSDEDTNGVTDIFVRGPLH